MSASRRPSRPGGRSTGPGRTRAARRTARAAAKPKVERVRVRPQARLSRRAAVLALALSALALAYAYPLRTFVEQRIEINRLEAAHADQRDRIAELESERAKWDDEEYVKAQIRSSLLLVEPGEDLVIVFDEDDPGAQDRPDDAEERHRAWYEELMETFEDADQLEPEPAEGTQQ